MPSSRRLYSRRLFLRRLRKSDGDKLVGLINSNRRYLSFWLPPFPEKISRSLAQEWIADEHKLLRQGQRIDLGLFSQQNGSLIGRLALHSISWGVQRSAGISYWISETEAGQGKMTEAVATVLSFAFEECRLHRIYAEVAPENKPSLAICSRLGFRNEGSSLKKLFINGCWQNIYNFAMLEEEYDRMAESWIKQRLLGV